jgi:N-acetyl-anhydromuramyl-L-alanine amidase AmpD
VGITIHHLGEHNHENAMASLKKQKLGYHGIIARDGQFIQTAYFSDKVNHAGKALWNGTSPNRRHISVAIASWGEVKKDPAAFKYTTWAGSRIPLFEVNLRKGNIDNDWHFWDMATPEQEATLFRFLRWAVDAGIDPKNICGHDECAIPFGRKNDPGGVISMTMPQLRAVIASGLA